MTTTSPQFNFFSSPVFYGAIGIICLLLVVVTVVSVNCYRIKRDVKTLTQQLKTRTDLMFANEYLPPEIQRFGMIDKMGTHKTTDPFEEPVPIKELEVNSTKADTREKEDVTETVEDNENKAETAKEHTQKSASAPMLTPKNNNLGFVDLSKKEDQSKAEKEEPSDNGVTLMPTYSELEQKYPTHRHNLIIMATRRSASAFPASRLTPHPMSLPTNPVLAPALCSSPKQVSTPPPPESPSKKIVANDDTNKCTTTMETLRNN